jgi:hypothetical protein
MQEKQVELEDELVLPTAPHEPEKNMASCILFGKEKCGKTTALSMLDNCLIVDTEKGSKKVKATSICVPDDLGPVGKMNWLRKLAAKLKAEKPYDYVAIDTFTEIDSWAEWSGTYRYMNSVQGKTFNRVKDERGNPIKGGAFLDPDHDDYQSVHTLPEGYGYRWSRDEIMDIFHRFQDVAKKCVFFVCHIEDKFVALKDSVDGVNPKQLALTGKVREILPRKVDAVGHVYNEKGIIKVSFTGNEERLGGNRCEHLRGYNDLLDWNKIFIKD